MLTAAGLTDIAWFRPDGNQMTAEDWGTASAMAVFVNGEEIAAPDYRGRKVRDDSFFVLFNPSPDAVRFMLPRGPYVEVISSGSFLQLGQRRAWVIARPPGGSREVLRTQINHGSEPLASPRLAQGGWIAVSQQIAAEHHTGVGRHRTAAPCSAMPARPASCIRPPCGPT